VHLGKFPVVRRTLFCRRWVRSPIYSLGRDRVESISSKSYFIVADVSVAAVT
jgi:hypothetical protein